MTQYKNLIVKLCNSQIIMLKPGIKYGTEVALDLSQM